MTIRKISLAGVALTLLAGCQTAYLPVDDAGHHTAAPAPNAALLVPPSPASTPAAPIPLAALSDTCDANGLQYLVGKPKTEIPVPVNPGRRQVTCTSCTLAPDMNLTRTTILFDQSNGLVTEVMCR